MNGSGLEYNSINREDGYKKRSRFDLILLISITALAVFGLIIIYSATKYSMPGVAVDPQYYLRKQGIFFGISVGLFIIVQFFNYRVLKKYWWIFLMVHYALLISVLLFGYEVNSSKSWIDLGVSSIQPSEFSKVLMVVSIAAVLSKWPREKTNKVGFKKVILSAVIAFSSVLLVVMEPDFGTALIYFAVYLGMLLLSGANILYFISVAAISAGGIFMAIKLDIIKQYQLDRILMFLKPDAQMEGAGYNLFQSKLAIGSGGLWGNGLFLGKQTNLNYVPEHHTDFIFSVIGEEMGFIGALLIIVVFCLIIWRCFYISLRSNNSFGSLIAAGVGLIVLVQVIINIGMSIGLMPIIGIPLPFLSSGGSSLLSIFIGMALVENVYFRRELRKEHEIAYDAFD